MRQERNILLVLLDGLSSATLRQAVRRHLGEEANVHVVAPTRVGMLDWLATDEDAARATAEVQALEAEWALADDADVEGEAGDVDPVLAVEDALRRFDADEIVLVEERAKTAVLKTRSSGLTAPLAGWTITHRCASEMRDASSAARSGPGEARRPRSSFSPASIWRYSGLPRQSA
jgi:ADP-ribose pyrophosphatase YjhB (NUDIX family)